MKIFTNAFKRRTLFLMYILTTAFNGIAQDLEFGPASNGAGNGPSTDPVVVTFLENTSGNTFTTYTPTLTATYSLSNQQYTIGGNSVTNGVVFGYGVTGSPNTGPMPIFGPMNLVGSPANNSYTSRVGATGTGIDVAANRAVHLYTTTRPLFVANSALNGRYQYADLTITFNRPVNNPVLHLVGLGAFVQTDLSNPQTKHGFTSELELQTPGITLTKLSGTTELTLDGTNRKILNSSANPDVGCGDGAMCGSVVANGQGITSLTFRIFLKGDNITRPNEAWQLANEFAGDQFLIGVSLQNPISLSGNVFNDMNGLTDNTIAGTGTNAGGLFVNLVNTAGNVVATATVNANGTYSFPEVFPGNYTTQLSTNQGTVGSAAPDRTLPAGWANIGEGIPANGDGTVDGSIAVTVATTNITGVNFGINQIPIATNDNLANQIPGNAATVPNILSNDSDPNNGTLSAANISLIAPAGATNVTTDGQGDVTGFTVPNQGIWALNTTTGEVTFTPQTGFTADPTPITYTVRDAAGLISNPAQLSADYNQPQPVKLVAFTGKAMENEVKLAWSTSEEINSSHYVVEHSLSAESWRELGKVAAKGKSWSLSGYSFSDTNPASGNNYYRLKMVDLDGTYAYSPIISVRVSLTEKVTLWPNPASSILKVSGLNGKLVKIYNAMGVLQIETRVEQGQITINRLPGGVYVLQVMRDGVEPPFIQKFVVSQ